MIIIINDDYNITGAENSRVQLFFLVRISIIGIRAFDILISFDEWRDCVAGGKERHVNGAEGSRWIRCIREICTTTIFG